MAERSRKRVKTVTKVAQRGWACSIGVRGAACRLMAGRVETRVC